jgi:glycosyltransferase involved in cell wall biosynthesis
MKIAYLCFNSLFVPNHGASKSMRTILACLAERAHEIRAVGGPQCGARVARPEDALCHGGEVRASTQFDGFEVETAFGTYLSIGTECVRTCCPTDDVAAPFLRQAEKTLDEFRPDVVLTSAHRNMAKHLIEMTARRGIALVPRYTRFEEDDYFAMRRSTLVLTCSRALSAHFSQRAGRAEFRDIHPPIDDESLARVSGAGTAITYVAPTLDKGAAWAARVLDEIARTRPEIPLLVVEGRGRAAHLFSAVPSLATRRSLQCIESVRSPAEYLERTRVLLVPYLREPAGRVAQEALIAGVPMVAARRGGLTEIVGDGAIVHEIPDRYTPDTAETPSAEEVSEWVASALALYDDPVLHETWRGRARREGGRFLADALAPQYEAAVKRASIKAKLAAKCAPADATALALEGRFLHP